jgi:hypothetical protein
MVIRDRTCLDLITKLFESILIAKTFPVDLCFASRTRPKLPVPASCKSILERVEHANVS